MIPRDRWDPAAAKIVALIPDPNVAGTNIYASTPVTETRQDQFDVRVDHQLARTVTAFARYSFVDTDTFRPSPLPDLAEGSFNDAFGSNLNRSQGLAVGATWIASSTLIGEFRLGFTRGNYFTYPPNVGVDAAADFGIPNVPNDPAIVGGLPKMNIQGFDAVGRHTSTPQFQTPRSWNPRASFTMSRSAHTLKFGFEFLHVQTKINDLNATIGRMNFEDRFTGRAVGDLLVGLPSQLALTSYTVMDQGQDMQFYYLQDDWRVTPRLTLNLGLRYEFATPPREKRQRARQLRSGDRDDGVREGRQPVRSGADPPRPQQRRSARRIRLLAARPLGRARRVRHLLQPHRAPGTRRDARLQPAVPRGQPAVDVRQRSGGGGVGGAVSTQSGLPVRVARPEHAGANRGAARAGCQSEDRHHSPVQPGRPARADTRPDDRRRVCRQCRAQPPRLPQSEPARGHPERERIAGGRRAAVSGLRRHPVDGESRRVRLQLAAGERREADVARPDRPRELYVGPGVDRRPGPHFDQRRRRRRRHGHLPRAAGRQQPRRRARPRRVRHRAPLRRQLRVGAAVRPRPPLRQGLEQARPTSCSAAGN